MVHRIHDILSGLYMTILAGLFLLLDGIPHLIEEFGGQRPFQNIFPLNLPGLPLLFVVFLLYICLYEGLYIIRGLVKSRQLY